MLRMSGRVEGARVAEAMPSSAGSDEHQGATGEGNSTRSKTEGSRANQQQSTATDAIPQPSHRNERAGQQKAVDVSNPEQLGTGRMQGCADPWKRQIQHGRIQGVEQAGQGDDQKPYPSTVRCAGKGSTAFAMNIFFPTAIPVLLLRGYNKSNLPLARLCTFLGEGHSFPGQSVRNGKIRPETS